SSTRLALLCAHSDIPPCPHAKAALSPREVRLDPIDEHSANDAQKGPHMAIASFPPLTPLAFLERSADVFADKTAIAYGDRRLSYREFGAEASRLALALRASGVQRGG